MIRFNQSCLAALAAAPLWLCAPQAQAQDDVDPYALSPEQLFGATVISASRTNENIWTAPAAIYVVTAADIEAAGATSIPEALRLVPGVQVARINTSGWAVSVRGFNSALANKLLVLIDGRETYDPLFSGVYWDVQDLVLEDIDRIEVIRGPGASLWGANAVNGVINIITKRASETQGALVSAITGDIEQASVSARYGGAMGENAHWRVYGRGFDRAPQERLSGGGDNSDWNAWRGGFRLDWAPAPQNTLTFQGDLYHSETGQFRSVPSLSAPYAIDTAETIVAEGGNALVRWTRDFEHGGQLIVQSYADVTRRNQLTLEDRRTTFDVDVQYDFPAMGAHALVAGARYRHTTDRVVETAIITSDRATHRSDLASVFVQDQITLALNWRLTLGSKFDLNDYTDLEVQPTARLQWNGRNHMAWASMSRAVRSPSELEREFVVQAGVIPPSVFPVPIRVELRQNPEFESEEVLSAELGYRWQIGSNVGLDVALFHNAYDGLSTLSLLPGELVITPLHLVQPIAMTNETEAQAQGVEVAFDWRVSDTLSFEAAYSFLDLELSGPPASLAIAAEAAEDQAPRNQANLRMHWAPHELLTLDGTLYYVDDLPSLDVSAYVRADIRLAYRLTDELQFELVGQDIFDEGHREFSSPGDANAAIIQRSIFGRLTWRS